MQFFLCRISLFYDITCFPVLSLINTQSLFTESRRALLLHTDLLRKKEELEQVPRGSRIPPGWRHFLIIKYFKVNDNDIRQDIVYNVSL